MFICNAFPLRDPPLRRNGKVGNMASLLGLVAKSFADYLWLLAGGSGPYEAIAYPGLEREPNPAFTAFAQEHAAAAKKPAREVIAEARREFPSFEKDVRAACR